MVMLCVDALEVTLPWSVALSNTVHSLAVTPWSVLPSPPRLRVTLMQSQVACTALVRKGCDVVDLAESRHSFLCVARACGDQGAH
jgi:hypothetical protein